MIKNGATLSIMLVVCTSTALEQNVQKISDPTVRPLIVLGSGPAGLTAAHHSTRLGIPTMLISGMMKGGLLVQTTYVENYAGVKKILGSSLMDTMIEQVSEAGTTIVEDVAVSVDLSQWPFKVTLESGEIYSTLALIIATGATPKRLQVPGEEIYWGKGISPCALCDGPFFKNKDVVIVGGGDSAVEQAMQLSAHVRSVTILVRGHRMRAAYSMQQKLKGYPNIRPVEYNKVVTHILGDENTVTELEVLNVVTNKKETISADGLFLAIGHQPNTDLFDGHLALSDSGYIIINSRTQATSVRGVFAAGDVEDAFYRQVDVATGSGCKAGINVVSWLRSIGVTEAWLKNKSLAS